MAQVVAYDLGHDKELASIVISNVYSVYVLTIVGLLVSRLLIPIERIPNMVQFHHTFTEAVVTTNRFWEFLAQQLVQGHDVGVFPALNG
jgi:hypothetical protein